MFRERIAKELLVAYNQSPRQLTASIDILYLQAGQEISLEDRQNYDVVIPASMAAHYRQNQDINKEELIERHLSRYPENNNA